MRRSHRLASRLLLLAFVVGALALASACGGGGHGGGSSSSGPSTPTGSVAVTNEVSGGGGAIASVEFLDPVTFALLFSQPIVVPEGGGGTLASVPVGTYGMDCTFADGTRATFVTPGTLTVTEGGLTAVTFSY
jgi:hypothetical protein